MASQWAMDPEILEIASTFQIGYEAEMKRKTELLLLLEDEFFMPDSRGCGLAREVCCRTNPSINPPYSL